VGCVSGDKMSCHVQMDVWDNAMLCYSYTWKMKRQKPTGNTVPNKTINQTTTATLGVMHNGGVHMGWFNDDSKAWSKGWAGGAVCIE
jgi:hypothetical protein